MSDDGQTNQNSGETNHAVPPARTTAGSLNHQPATAEQGAAIANSNERQPPQFLDIDIDRWIELASILIVTVATVVNVYVANRQWSAMVESNRINRESFTSVQRAFITISNFDTPVRLGDVPGGQGKQQKYWWFIPNIKNSGNTPTKNMKYFIGATCPQEFSFAMAGHMAIVCDFTRQDILDPVDIFNGPNFKGKDAIAILGPQNTIALGGIGITETSIQAVLKGFKIFVFGLIYYNDTFSETKRHVTKFCYQAGANLSDKNEIISSFGFCDHWNCADDECDDDKKMWQADLAIGKIQKPFEIPKGATPFNVPIPEIPAPPASQPESPPNLGTSPDTKLNEK